MLMSPKFTLPPLNEDEKQYRKEHFHEIMEPKNTPRSIFESLEELVKFDPDLAEVLFVGFDYPKNRYPYYNFDVRECGDQALVETKANGDADYYLEIPRKKYLDCRVFVRVTSDSFRKTKTEEDPWITFYGYI